LIQLPYIHIISDYGNGSHYAASIRSAFLRENIAHIWNNLCNTIPIYDSLTAAFNLYAVMQDMPEQSIFLVAVDSKTNDAERKLYIATHNNRHLITTNLQVVQLALAGTSSKIFAYPIDFFEHNPSFAEKDVMVQAVKLIYSQSLNETFEISINHQHSMWQVQTINDKLLKAQIIHIDAYQNVITNLRKPLFESYLSRYASFSIEYTRRYRTNKLVKNYADETSGSVVALFNYLDLLEVAIVNGEASPLLGLQVGKNILIEFYD
jgi:S-adenosylmethionine hydrolase